MRKAQSIGTRLDMMTEILKQIGEIHITQITETNRMKLELSQTRQQQQILEKEQETAASSGSALTSESSKKKAAELDSIISIIEKQESVKTSPLSTRVRSSSGSDVPGSSSTSVSSLPSAAGAQASQNALRTRGFSVSTAPKDNSRIRGTVMDLFSNPPPEKQQ